MTLEVVSSSLIWYLFKILSYLGNMSNPLVNRWGANIYWSKLWYSDQNYTTNLKQDSVFIQLLKMYFMYGLQTPVNLFLLKYWYFSKKIDSKQNHLTFTNKYYRRYSKNLALGEKDNSYTLRLATKDIFPMKVWIFKFQNWILLNFYWFQPLKKSTFKQIKKQPKTFSLLQLENHESLSSLRRYRLFLSKNLYTVFYNRLHYRF